ITPGAWFRQTFMPEARGGRPFTTEGIWLINFGIAGVIFGLFLTGCVLKELDILARSVLTVGHATLVCVLLFRVFLSGVSSLTLIGLVRYALPMIFFMYFVTLPIRRSPQFQRSLPGGQGQPAKSGVA
ncbi:MAG TPA: hypothetical protein VLI06_20690, partial [Solimonas sp.]|nr:hypothetical protein [Solimonas sp.]